MKKEKKKALRPPPFGKGRGEEVNTPSSVGNEEGHRLSLLLKT